MDNRSAYENRSKLETAPSPFEAPLIVAPSVGSSEIHPHERLSHVLSNVWSTADISGISSQETQISTAPENVPSAAPAPQAAPAKPARKERSSKASGKSNVSGNSSLVSRILSQIPSKSSNRESGAGISSAAAETKSANERLSIVKEDSLTEVHHSRAVQQQERTAEFQARSPNAQIPVITVSSNRLSITAHNTFLPHFQSSQSLNPVPSVSSAVSSNIGGAARDIVSEIAAESSTTSAAERLLKQAELEEEESQLSAASSTASAASGHKKRKHKTGKKKPVLKGLFGKWTSKGNMHSANSLMPTSSDFSLCSTDSYAMGPWNARSGEKSHVVEMLADCHAMKADHIDNIFAKAAISKLNVAKEKADGDKSGVDLREFPDDLPAIYAVLLAQLETDMVFEKLIPFTLRRLCELPNFTRFSSNSHIFSHFTHLSKVPWLTCTGNEKCSPLSRRRSQMSEFGSEKGFLDHIKNKILACEEEIRRVCSAHAMVFTESAREFVDLNERIDKLRDDVVTLDDRDIYANQIKEIRYAGKETKRSGTVLTNVAVLMERISAIRPALKGLAEALPYARSAEPVKALRKLCFAESCVAHLPAEIHFVSWLAGSIPDMKQKLVTASLTGVTQALETLWNHNSQAGFAILRNVCHLYHMQVEPFVSKNVVEMPYNAIGIREPRSHRDSHASVQKVLNLRALYNFRHIVKTLVDLPVGIDVEYLFHCYVTYMADRHLQILKLLEDDEISDIKNLTTYVQKIAGLFGFEMYISLYVPGITSELYYEHLWQELEDNVEDTLEKGLSFVKNETQYLRVRDLFRLFAATMGMLRCDPDNILGALETLGSRYCKLLLDQLVAAISQAFSKDLFSPMILMTETEKTRFLETFDPWNGKPGMDGKHYPLKLPFSSSVPEIYGLVKKYLVKNIQIDRDLGVQSEETLQRALEITSSVFIMDFHGIIEEVYRKSYLLVPQFVQLYHNFGYMEESLASLEKIVFQELKFIFLEGSSEKISCGKVFDRLRLETENQLLAELTGYISAVLHDSRLDQTEHPEEMSAQGEKVISFVEAFFKQTRGLRPEYIIKAYAMLWQHIPSVLETVWIYDSPVISLSGLMQLKMDIDSYELFLKKQADELGIVPTKNEAFESLLQLIQLVLTEDWQEYISKFGQKDSHYNLAAPASALRILGKLNDIQEEASTSNMYLSAKSEKARRNKRDLLILQLDDLATIGKVAHFKIQKTKSNLTAQSDVSMTSVAEKVSQTLKPVDALKTASSVLSENTL